MTSARCEGDRNFTEHKLIFLSERASALLERRAQNVALVKHYASSDPSAAADQLNAMAIWSRHRYYVIDIRQLLERGWSCTILSGEWGGIGRDIIRERPVTFVGQVPKRMKSSVWWSRPMARVKSSSNRFSKKYGHLRMSGR
jgi:hypothetical protein